MSERRTPESEVAINFHDANTTTSPRDVYAVTERSEFGDSATFRKTPTADHYVSEHEVSNLTDDREREEYEILSIADSSEKQEEDESMPVWARELLKMVSSIVKTPHRIQSPVKSTQYNTFSNQETQTMGATRFTTGNQRTVTTEGSITDYERNNNTYFPFYDDEKRYYNNSRLDGCQNNNRQYAQSQMSYERLQYPNSFEIRRTPCQGFGREHDQGMPDYSLRNNERQQSQEKEGAEFYLRDGWDSTDTNRVQRRLYNVDGPYHGFNLPRAPNHTTYRAPRRSFCNRGLIESIPCFSGKEDWSIWINRFEIVADRQGLSEEERLDLLMPKLTGEAAELVFTQLPKAVLWNYDWLVKEITNRFRVIETAKTFAAKFSQRNQQDNETAEAYAAELKRLYDKAHPGRDGLTRQEDLLRRFLDGLRDSEVKWQVEYVKEPRDIDEAVYQVVSFVQLRGRFRSRHNGDRRNMNHVRRATQIQGELVNEEGQEMTNTNLAWDTARRVIRTGSNDSLAFKNESLAATQNKEKSSNTAAILQNLVQSVDALVTELKQPAPQKMSFQSRATASASRKCFNCGEVGHFKRDCPFTSREGNPHQNWQRHIEIGHWEPRGKLDETYSNGHLNGDGLNSMVGGRSVI